MRPVLAGSVPVCGGVRPGVRVERSIAVVVGVRPGVRVEGSIE